MEMIGLLGLWALGMTASIPMNWPNWLVVAAVSLSVFAIVLYGARAISERRSRNSHYFKMALLSILLTAVSLGTAAIKLPGGAQFVSSVFIIAVLIFLSAVYFKLRTRQPATAA